MKKERSIDLGVLSVAAAAPFLASPETQLSDLRLWSDIWDESGADAESWERHAGSEIEEQGQVHHQQKENMKVVVIAPYRKVLTEETEIPDLTFMPKKR